MMVAPGVAGSDTAANAGDQLVNVAQGGDLERRNYRWAGFGWSASWLHDG